MKKNTDFTRPEMRGVSMNDYLKQYQSIADDDELDVDQQQEILQSI